MVRSIPLACAYGTKSPAINEDIGAPGISTNLVISQQITDEMVITNVTAHPIPKAILTFFDTPIKGHCPTK